MFPRQRAIGSESRLTRKLSERFGNAWENVKGLGRRVDDTYFRGPYRRDDNYQKLLGPPIGVVDGMANILDESIAGLANKKLPPLEGRFFVRTRRDVKELVGDVVRLKPINAALDVFRLISLNPLIDTADLVGGFEHGKTAGIRGETAARVRRVLREDPSVRLN